MAIARATAASNPFTEVRDTIDSFPTVDLHRVDDLFPPLADTDSVDERLPGGAVALEINGLRQELRELGQALEGLLENSVLRVETVVQELLVTRWRSEQNPGADEEGGGLSVQPGLAAPPRGSHPQLVGKGSRPPPLSEDDPEPTPRPSGPRCTCASAGLWPEDVRSPIGLQDVHREQSTALAKASLHDWLKSPHSDQLQRHGRSTTSNTSRQKLKRVQTCYSASAFLIFANIVFMVVDVELSMAAVANGREPPGVLWWLSSLFVLAFIAELAVRFCLERRRQFFCGRLWRWNLFDGIVVILQAVDLIVKLSHNLGVLRGLRLLRAAPAARMVHAMRHVQELRLMVVTIRCSLASLFWAQVILVFCLFCIALGFQQVVLTQVATQGLGNVHPQLLEYYGSTQESLLTVFMAISGGQDWRDLVAPLEEISKLYLVVFSVLVGSLLYGLLNILIGVFVECSGRARHTSCLSNIQGTLESMDPENSGRISSQDFDVLLQDTGFIEHLALLGLGQEELQGVVLVLDMDNEGTVAILDIVSALTRLSGHARSLDIATTLYENKRILSMVSSVLEAVSTTTAHKPAEREFGV